MKQSKEQKNPKALSKKVGGIPRDEQKLYYYGIFSIVLITFLLYSPILQNTFTNWDDNSYIENNPLIRTVNLKAIFSTNLMGNYHPLTVLLYAIEFQFFKLNASGYYFVNLLLHLLNTLLAIRVAFLLSNQVRISLAVGLLFGIHPIHVESVAWASELKDLLYTFFYLFSYICYLKYLKDKRRKSYNLSIFLFLLSLLSKAMAVSLPIVLILTDYFLGRKINMQTLKEKIPFFLLSIIFGLVAVKAQQLFGSTESTVFPLAQRIVFASYAFITYLVKLILPVDLCSYYPYPIKPGQEMPFEYYFYAAGLLVIVSLLVIYRRKIPQIFFAMSFFAITVALVLQIMPVGDTIMADRYGYIPSLGIFYLASTGLYRLWVAKRKTLSITLLSVFGVFFCVQTHARCDVWKNGMSLWNDVIRQHDDAAAAYSNRGFLEMIDKKYDEALSDFNKAIELKPDYAFAYNNRAVVYKNFNRLDDVLSDLNKAISIKPDYFDAYNNRGIVYTTKKQYNEAVADFNRALEIRPNSADAFLNRGIVFYYSGLTNDACNDFRRASRLGSERGAELLRNYCH